MSTSQAEVNDGSGVARADGVEAAGQKLALYLASSAARHMAAVDALASEVQRPVAEIHLVYYAELTRLARCATVLDFLPVLVMKRVRDRYHLRLRALKTARSQT